MADDMGLRFGKEASRVVDWISPSRVHASYLGPNLDSIAVRIILAAFQIVHLNLIDTRMSVGGIKHDMQLDSMARSCLRPRTTATTILVKPSRAMTAVSKMFQIHSREGFTVRTVFVSAPALVEPRGTVLLVVITMLWNNMTLVLFMGTIAVLTKVGCATVVMEYV
jgi:hypothetical protein